MLQEAKTVPEKDLRMQRFFGKRRRFAPQNAGTQRRALNRAPKKYRRTFWEKEQPAFKQRVCCNANSCGFCRPFRVPEKDLRTQRFFGKRRSRRAGRAFCPAKRWHAKACSRRGCGGRIRTCDLRVMSPTSYRTAPLRDIGTPSAEMLYNFIALPSVCQLFFTRQSKIFADAPRRGALSVLQK